MKWLVFQIWLITFCVGCGSFSLDDQFQRQEFIKQHLLRGKQYVGGGFEPLYEKSGNDGQFLRAIGLAVYPATTSEAIVRSAAVTDGKQKLITSAPTEFRSMVQSAMGSASVLSGQVNAFETVITNVKGLEGIEVQQSNIDCRLVIEPNIEGSFRNNRECRAVVEVPVSSIRKALDYTIEQEKGDQFRVQVENMLDKQIQDFLGDPSDERRTESRYQRNDPQPESKVLFIATSGSGAPNLQSVANKRIAPRLQGEFQFIPASSFSAEARRLGVNYRDWNQPFTIARVGTRLHVDYVVSIHTRTSPPTRAFLSLITLYEIGSGKAVLHLAHEWSDAKDKQTLSDLVVEKLNRYLGMLNLVEDFNPTPADLAAETQKSLNAALVNRMLEKF